MTNIKDINKLEEVINTILKDKTTHGLSRSLRSLKKEIKAYKSSSLSANPAIDYQNKSIQVGGGVHTLEGYINVDIFPPADIIIDVREGLPFEDQTIKSIFAEHFFEHIDYPTSAKSFISESYRVLKNGGEIIIGVPDGEQIMKAYVNRDKVFFKEMLERWYKNRDCREHFNTYIDLVNYHFRDQDDSEKYNPHFWTYDFEKLSNMLNTAGFKEIEKWKFDSNIANPKREFGSIYVLARK